MARENAARQEEPADDEEPTLRETLEAAAAEANRADDEAAAAPTPSPAAEGTARDESGRFASRQAPEEDAGAVPASPAPARGAATSGEAQPSPGAATPPDTSTQLAPQYWSNQSKAEWLKLPAVVQQEIHRREQFMHRELTKQDGERQVARNFNQATQDFRDVVERSGVTPLRLYTDFLGIMRTLTTGTPEMKTALLRDVAMRQGLDLRALAGMPAGAATPPGAQNAPAPSPGTPLPPQILQWGQEWQQFKVDRQREVEETQRTEQARTMQEIMEFRAKPEARFFDQVKDTMIALLHQGAAQTLQDAYDAAVWARPDTRAILEKERSDKTAADQRAREGADRARRKGGGVRGSTGGLNSETPAGDRTLRQELEANFASARSRI